ncbi:MAG: hypothetical protein ACREFQ_14170 [Stellaceae bacterium]
MRKASCLEEPQRIYYHPESGDIETAGGGEDHGSVIALADLTEWRDNGVLLERLAHYERAATLPPFEIAPAVLAAICDDGSSERGFGPR